MIGEDLTTRTEAVTTGKLLKFYVPLALQAMSQSLTYPLVAMVASAGKGGAANLAGLAQSNIFLWFLGSFGFGLLTTGMTYAKTKEGFFRFQRITWAMMSIIAILHGICSIPHISHLIFGKIIGLPPDIEKPAVITFRLCLPLQVLFLIRNPMHVALFNAHATGKAYVATLGRIGLTALMSPLFRAFKLVGPEWAVVCLTLPLIVEVIVSYVLSRPYIQNLQPGAETPAPYGEIFRFALTLSVGYIFLSLSSYILGGFIARAPDPERVLPAYYMALGLASPVMYGTIRIQALTVAFSGAKDINNKLLRFGLCVGCVMGALPLLFIIPGLAEFYYIGQQHLPPGDLSIVRITALLFALIPIAVAVRAYSEGRAAILKRPEVILTGQATFLGIMVSAAFITQELGMQGYEIGAVSIGAANISAAIVIFLALGVHWRKETPAPPSRPSVRL